MAKRSTRQAMFYCSGKKEILFTVLLLCSAAAVMAQPAPAVSKKRLIREANADYYDGHYHNAWLLYRQVLAFSDAEAVYSLKAAECAVNLGYPSDSLVVLSPALEKANQPDVYYYLALIRHQQHQFDEATDLLRRYTEFPPRRRQYNDEQVALLKGHCQNAKTHIAAPSPAHIRNIGPAVNSAFADYVPVISPDENALYFTSRRPSAEHPERNGDGTFYEDVYVSYRKDGNWTPAQSVGFPINTETNDACVAISTDGQRMIIYRTAADIRTGDLYLTSAGAGGRWLPPQKMGKEVNSPHIETSACFSNDSAEIFFSSDRPDGLGGKDLYRIRKLPNGEWSTPMNLGPEVNTPTDEDAPFLHPDGVTLYFSSRGHNSMGDYDVFRSVWNHEINKFSAAENLGYPINDVGSDIFFVLSVDGQRAYYTTSRKGDLGGTDIYEIDTRFGPTDLQVLHGKVVLGTRFGKARITLTDTLTGQVHGYYNSHPETGKFILAVNPHRAYVAEIESEGFTNQTMTLTPNLFEEKDFTFILQPAGAQ